jgi:glycerol-3-phosphate acyltransferase PlsX
VVTSYTIAIDAMGGDFAPRNVIRGVVAALRESDVSLVLVGRESELRQELGSIGAGDAIEIVDAPEVVGMDEAALTPIRKKKLSSIRVAAELVQEGRAAGLVSAGNTGASMACAKLIWGCLDGVDRPALATVLPNVRGVSVLLDAGANVECRPEHLVQFAVMGHVYAKAVLGMARPRVGLLSVGEEDVKGNEVTREANRVLKESSFINFIGNVEGSHIFDGTADVIVTDGFTGNVALKVSEAVADALGVMIQQEMSRTVLSRLAALASWQALARFRKRIDYGEYGGAPLLGLNGVAIVCHGRSSPKAIKNAIRMAHEFISHGSNEKINQGIRESSSAGQHMRAV